VINVRTDGIIEHNVRTYEAAEQVLMRAESFFTGAEQLHKVLPVLKCIIHYTRTYMVTWSNVR